MKLNQQLLHEFLSYCPRTGILRWKRRHRWWFTSDHSCKTWNTRFAGQPAGSLGSDGYTRISLLSRRYTAHRVIWLMVTGKWPSVEIDHRNRKRSDNRFVNLKDGTRTDNQRNRTLNKNNKSGFAGVYYDARDCRWVAKMKRKGKTKHLGSFATKRAAVAARRAAQRRFWK
jgi:hypothetical protein